MMKFISTSLFLIVFSSVYSQKRALDSLQKIGVCDLKGFCISTIKNNIRPKGFSIIQQRVIDYNLRTQFKDSNWVDEREIRRNKSIEIKAKIPILLKENYNFIIGLNYRVEEFSFSDPDKLSNELHKYLEDRDLKSVGATFYLDRKFKGRHFLYGRAGVFLNGSFNKGRATDYLRSSLTVLYGTKVDGSKVWGIGLSYSYRFGRLALYPILHYNKQFNKKWGFEMALPVKTEFRYQLNDKNIFYLTNRLGGENYVLDASQLSRNKLFLGKSHFLSFLTYEREIYDFLWLSFSAGAQVNINFDLETKNRLANNKEEPFIDNRLDPAPMIRFGLFLVPPKRFYSKLSH
ncbi:MAG: hypothetical protein JKY48_04760 [Flavobacteriales bacterium]|nr:hypothetical protein [Flavobacteriales bacterium]